MSIELKDYVADQTLATEEEAPDYEIVGSNPATGSLIRLPYPPLQPAGGRGSLFFDQDNPQVVNCGKFYIDGSVYSHFFWEGWVKFTKISTTGYAWIDGYGGSHMNILGATSGTTHASLVGKYYAGSADYGDSNENFPLNEWVHIAHGWDGSHYMHWINGCLSFVVAEATARTVPVAASNGQLYIGGPADHSMWEGNIAAVRGFEGSGCFARALPNGATDFYPERYFRPHRFISAAFEGCEFAMDLTAPMGVYPDLSLGFDADAAGRVHHHGALAGEATGTDFAIFANGDYPTWQAGDIAIPTYDPTPPSIPVGAIVFDSFSRPESTFAFYRLGTDSVTGNTEAGSAGIKTWTLQNWPVRGGRLAYWYNTLNDNRITGLALANYSVSVKRVNNAYCNTGLVLRYQDASNYINIQAAPSSIRIQKIEAGVTTNVDFVGLSTNWTTLRANLNGVNLEVFRDGVSVGTTTTTIAGNGDPGLYAASTGTKSVTRFDDFLVEAAS